MSFKSASNIPVDPIIEIFLFTQLHELQYHTYFELVDKIPVPLLGEKTVADSLV